MLTEKYISIVVACYRDEGSILELLRRLDSTMERISLKWEVIYVNDHSPDNAELVLIQEAKKNPRLTVISHSRNFGAQTAFTTGMKQAVGDCIIIMDGDLQDPPELIEEFVRTWLSGFEVVFGIRAKRNEGYIRNLGYKLFYKIFRKISYLDIPLDAGEFSLMDRKVVDVINQCPERDRLIRGLRSYAGFRQTGIPFERPERYSGKSTQSFFDYVMWAVQSFTSFSTFPLRLITFIAFTLTILLLGLLVFYLCSYLFLDKNTIPKGYMTLLVLQLGIGLMVMFALGIIGEYIGRLFIEIKQRPQQVISLLLNDHKKP